MNAIDLADQVVLTLNDGGYQPAFTAVRKLFPFYELKDLTQLHVTVLPKSVNMAVSTRTKDELDYQIDVAVQKTVKTPDDAEINSLMQLALAIAKSFRGKVYPDFNAVCIKQSIDPLYSIEHIQPPSVFTSVITLDFKVIE